MDTETKIEVTSESQELYDGIDFTKLRTKEIEKIKSDGKNPYPHKFEVTHSFIDIIAKYSDTNAGSHVETDLVSVAGRVMTIREASKKLYFMTVVSNGNSLQYLANLLHYGDKDNFRSVMCSISRGDIVGVKGFPGKSKNGELSVIVKELVLLTPCLRDIPKNILGIKDEEIRIRKRYLDLLVNTESRKPFIIRNQVFNYIRNYLTNSGFMEVQTPVLSSTAGGASAKPFVTYSNDLKQDMFMRIAPELYLKELVVGGFDKVFEIGPQFRNESLDASHSFEFYSLECYEAYADYTDMMKLCEKMLSGLTHNIHQTFELVYRPLNSDTDITINFKPPYRRIDFISEIEKCTGTTLPTDFTTKESNQFLQDLCNKFKVDCAEPRTSARLLDKLAGKLLEPQCLNPTFIINYPLVMSPLAKWHREKPHLTERFELFVAGFEVANAYTELNDPSVQRKTFEDQMISKAQGDDEAQDIDETFINSLEFGLPPCGGLGWGLDRIVMLMSNRNKIRDVVYFPAMRSIA